MVSDPAHTIQGPSATQRTRNSGPKNNQCTSQKGAGVQRSQQPDNPRPQGPQSLVQALASQFCRERRLAVRRLDRQAADALASRTDLACEAALACVWCARQSNESQGPRRPSIDADRSMLGPRHLSISLVRRSIKPISTNTHPTLFTTDSCGDPPPTKARLCCSSCYLSCSSPSPPPPPWLSPSGSPP